MKNQIRPATKKMVIIKGKGTNNDTRIETDIIMYWSHVMGCYITCQDR